LLSGGSTRSRMVVVGVWAASVMGGWVVLAKKEKSDFSEKKAITQKVGIIAGGPRGPTLKKAGVGRPKQSRSSKKRKTPPARYTGPIRRGRRDGYALAQEKGGRATLGRKKKRNVVFFQ